MTARADDGRTAFSAAATLKSPGPGDATVTLVCQRPSRPNAPMAERGRTPSNASVVAYSTPGPSGSRDALGDRGDFPIVPPHTRDGDAILYAPGPAPSDSVAPDEKRGADPMRWRGAWGLSDTSCAS